MKKKQTPLLFRKKKGRKKNKWSCPHYVFSTFLSAPGEAWGIQPSDRGIRTQELLNLLAPFWCQCIWKENAAEGRRPQPGYRVNYGHPPAPAESSKGQSSESWLRKRSLRKYEHSGTKLEVRDSVTPKPLFQIVYKRQSSVPLPLLFNSFNFWWTFFKHTHTHKAPFLYCREAFLWLCTCKE